METGAKKFSRDETLEILRKEEEKRRREAKRREEEILALMEEQDLDRQGKLWGEQSLTTLAEKVNGGSGADYTDIEARLRPDVDPETFGIDPAVYAQPMRAFALVEARDIAAKVIGQRWGQPGLVLFARWLDGTVALICKENNLPAGPTLATIVAMVLACRKEAGVPSFFPFPEEEEEIKKEAKLITQKAAIARIISGEAAPADPTNRIYLEANEKSLSLDKLIDLIKERYVKERYDFKIHRSTIWRAKKTGWFMRPGWDRGSLGEKVELTQDEKSLPLCCLAERFGISVSTADEAKKRGYFIILSSLKCKIKIPESRELTPEEKLLSMLPERISEVAGRKLSDLSKREIAQGLGVNLNSARLIKRRGYLNTLKLSRSKRLDLVGRIKKVETNGWPEISDPQKVFLIDEDRNASGSEVIKKYGIDRRRAFDAKKRGYFVAGHGGERAKKVSIPN